MGFPTEHTITDMGQGLVVEPVDAAGAVDFYIYEGLYTTTGTGQPKMLKHIRLTKTEVDTLCAAIQTVED